MKYESPDLTIEIDSHADGSPILNFTFSGKFTEKASREGSRFWDAILSNSRESCHFVWNCTTMTGFELSARKEWYKYMSIHKEKIKHVTVISGSVMIRSAARVMLELFGVSYSIHKPVEKANKKDQHRIM
jgi:hypothetical protein